MHSVKCQGYDGCWTSCLIFGQPFVKRFALCYWTIVLFCPVCHVGVLWPNGWMDEDETWPVGRPWLWPHCVRCGPSPPPPEGHSPPVFSPYLLLQNRWMDQDATWWGDKPWLRRCCVKWGPSSPQKGGTAPIFGPCLLWPNGWMDQDATWYQGRPWPRRHCVRWGPSPPSPPKGTHPQFSAHIYCGQTVAHLSYC